MAKVVLKECVIVVDGTDLSDHVSAVTVNLSRDDVDTTNFGGAGRERKQGLSDDSFELTFQQDFDSGSVDSVLYPLYDSGDDFEIVVKPFDAAVSPTNPSYTGDCILLEYSPLDGKPGDLSETKVKIPTQRNGITRATS